MTLTVMAVACGAFLWFELFTSSTVSSIDANRNVKPGYLISLITPLYNGCSGDLLEWFNNLIES